MGTLLNLYWIP